MIRVAVAGGFDPFHVGHLDHLQEAKKLGDYLIVLVSNDNDMVRKKGYCLMPLEERIEILRALRCVDEVVATIDEDGTQAKTLQLIKPDIFAKGGDRTPDNMPQEEIDACSQIGCQLVYGIEGRLVSSSKIIDKVLEIKQE